MSAQNQASERVYRTISGAQILLSGLSDPEYRFLEVVTKKYNAKQDWTRFAAWWNAKFNASGLTTASPVYRICQDLEARLGINQRKVSPPDYRDYLAELIDAQFGSRQEFCRATGVDPGQLSRVLASRDNLSIKVLQKVLEVLDAQLVIQREEECRAQTSVESAADALRATAVWRNKRTDLRREIDCPIGSVSPSAHDLKLEKGEGLVPGWRNLFPNVPDLERVHARAQAVAHDQMPLMLGGAA